MNTCPYCGTELHQPSKTCPNCGSRLQGWQLAVGTALVQKYQIQKVLGQGGFGITYLANDPTLQRLVAIKELFPDGSSRALDGSFLPPASNPDFLETKMRFIDEARVLAQFNHPSIVRIFDVFAANETAYLVMEALNGETLGSRIQRLGVMSEALVEHIAKELCAALEVVHAGGLLHRDIKPENVFLTNDKRVVLIDFGSARTFKSGQVMQHTQLITPGYAAPEQYATEAKFGAYTDVYGVAATLYFALTGQAPLSSSDRILTGKEIALPDGISKTLSNAIIAGLAIRIDIRPQTVQEFTQRLEDEEPKVYVGTEVQTKSLKPNNTQEVVFFRDKNKLLTSYRLEISHSTKFGIDTRSYPLDDFASLKLTNNGWEILGCQEADTPIAPTLIGLTIVSIVGYFSISGLDTFVAVWGIVGLVALAYGLYGCSTLMRKDLHYLIVTIRPNQRILLHNTFYRKYLEDIVEQVKQARNQQGMLIENHKTS